MKKRAIPAICLTFFIVIVGFVSSADCSVPPSVSVVSPATCPGLKPGDTVFVESGYRGALQIRDLHGTDGNPIKIINQGGAVDIDAGGGWVGIWIRNSDHLTITGTGSGNEYGFVVHDVSNTAVFGQEKTGYLDIDHVEVHGSAIGMSVKTVNDINADPVLRGEWVQHNTTIHHCYVHDISGEAMYIGSSSWQSGVEPELDGVYIYDNLITNIGYECIQVGSAPDNVEVHDNLCVNASLSTDGSPPTGANSATAFIINHGTTGDWYSNRIINAGGRGIYSQGTGNYDIYNNLIANTGIKGWDGISDGITVVTGGDGTIRFNTIVDAKNDGIDVTGDPSVRDNIIAGYGSSAVRGGNAFNNLASVSLGTIGFVNPDLDDFHLLPGSPAVDSGSSGYPASDLEGTARPQGAGPDIGAYELKGSIQPQDETYYVYPSDSIVDGRTFCDGPCTSSDTIIIKGGTRGALEFRNLDGKGNYISILNEDSTEKVVISTGSTNALTITKSDYVDLEGNTNPDFAYGIKIIRTTDSGRDIAILGGSDHIRIGHTELLFQASGSDGTGIQIGYDNEGSSVLYDAIEIHHNFIHDTPYSGMYLGHNQGPEYDNDDPFVADISVHDNILEDLGAYGFNVKGVSPASGPCYIYNNTIRRTGLIWSDPAKAHGISVHMFFGTSAEIYDNLIEDTEGAGLIIGGGAHSDGGAAHNVHDNIIAGCGADGDSHYGHGILTEEYSNNAHIYDNIIVQPTRYGLHNEWGTGTQHIDRNLVCDPGIGYLQPDPQFVEGTGADANIYYPDCADAGFSAWSDDGDYSNDKFKVAGPSDSMCGSFADLDNDGAITISELIDYISSWKTGGVTISSLIDAIGKWKSGC